MAKVILIVLGIVVGLGLLYAYVKHLFEEGYDEDEVYLHLFRDVPLRYLKKRKGYEEYYEKYGYQSRPREHETVDSDSYPSAYGWNCDPEVIALMNAPPADQEHNRKILQAGGWKCSCGKVHASYVSSCSCGRNKYEDPAPEPVSVQPAPRAEDEVENAAAIREYKKLLDEGIITSDEFEAKKKQLLGL